MSQVCLGCGACCASLRVSFYWAETDAHPCGTVPQALTRPVNPHYVAMLGTEHKPPRCAALSGEVGESVACTIYPLRSSTCREFEAGTDACNRARAAHRLPPVESAVETSALSAAD
jgi:uncharacterized protein